MARDFQGIATLLAELGRNPYANWLGSGNKRELEPRGRSSWLHW